MFHTFVFSVNEVGSEFWAIVATTKVLQRDLLLLRLEAWSQIYKKIAEGTDSPLALPSRKKPFQSAIEAH